MSKYLNVFNTLAEYQAFSASTEYVQPNVALVKETNVLYYDYGDNKPQVDMSDFKVESQEKSIGGDIFGKAAITKINYMPSMRNSLESEFQNHTSLKSIPEIPNNVTNMNYTFKGCRSLVTVPDIPSGVIYMNYTFQGCRSLVTVPDIPSRVINLNWAFSGCVSLKTITLLPTTPPQFYYTVSGCESLETIYVPDESVDAYKTATGWSAVADMIKPLSSKPTE